MSKKLDNEIINNIGYVRLTTFSDTTTSGMEKSVKEIKKELDIKTRWFLFWNQTHKTELRQNQKIPITM